MTKLRNEVRSLVLLGSTMIAACGAPEGSTSWTGDDALGATVGSTPPEDSGESTRSQALAPDPGFKSSEEPITEDAPLPTKCPPGKWCSALYPATWTPAQPADAEGRLFHDFSYAGYRHGEPPPLSPAGATYDVVAAYGADATGARDASGAIQSAIGAASAAGGGVVFFPAGMYRVDRTLNIGASNVVLRGVGTASVLRSEGTTIAFKGPVTRQAARPLAADAPLRANEVRVADATGLAPGDDVSVGWTITPAFIAEHGMTGTWTSFNGSYQRFFRAQVLSVDTTSSPHRIVLDVPLRYIARVRDGAAIQKETGYLREVGIEDLALTNATTWARAWSENHMPVATLGGVTDAWVRNVHSVPTPGASGRDGSDKRAYHLRNSGILFNDAKRISALGSSLENAQNRGGGGNGYLFELIGTNEALFADDVGRNGRHNFIQSWGFGTSGVVFLRCVSEGSEVWSSSSGPGDRAASETHHSLAMAVLVDDSRIEDGFRFENRRDWSSGAGHTATESVVWRASGRGTIISRQFGWGYVIGTNKGVVVDTNVAHPNGANSAPVDFVERSDEGETLWPPSLYEHQRARRLQEN